MDVEKVYGEITSIIKDSVKNKMMGPIYRVLLQKAIDEKLFYRVENAFAICHYLKTKNLLSIDKFAVDEQSRGVGIGTLLLNNIKENHPRIRVEVAELNNKAYKFYIKNGFIETNRRFIGNTKIITLTYGTNIR